MVEEGKANERILKRIREMDCEEEYKQLLIRIFIYELGRRKGEEFSKFYKQEIEKAIILIHGD